MKTRNSRPRQLPAILLGVLLAGAHLPMRAESIDAASKRGAELLKRGYTAKAIEAFQKAANLAAKSEGRQSANLCRINNSLAGAYLLDGQFAMADKLYRESFEGLSAAFEAGRGRVSADELGWALQNWANYYFELGQYAEAEVKAREALKIFEDNRLADSASSARYNLGAIYTEGKQFTKALEAYDSVLKYRLERFGSEDTRYSNALEGPGIVHLKLNNYDRAEPFFRKCLQVAETTFGRDRATSAMDSLAFTLRGLGRLDESRELYERLLHLAEQNGNEDWLAAVRSRLSTVAAYQDRWKEAIELCDLSRRFRINSAGRMSLGLADTELLSFLQILSDSDDTTSIGWARHNDAGVAEMSAAWSINERGFLYEAMAERLLLARDSRLSGQPGLFEELAATRRQYATLLQSGPGQQSKEDYIAELARLWRSETDLSHRIGLAAGRIPTQRKYIETSTLRQKLDPGTVLIHFAKTDLRDFDYKGGPKGPKVEPSFIAWVIPPAGRGEVAMFRIGAVSEIQAAIEKLAASFHEIEANRENYNQQLGTLRGEKLSAEDQQKRIEQFYSAFRSREDELEKSYRGGAAQDLSRLLLHPLLPAAGSFRRWVLCPDAELWMQPWNALLLPNGRYFVEEYSLSHVVTPRELAAGPRASVPQGPPLVISSPNYDLGVTGPQDRVWDVSLLRGFGAEWVGKFLPDLETFSTQRANVFIGDTATEDVIKKAGSPRLLFLATHGLFGKIDPKSMPPGFGLLKENPLVRSKLVFAGCNRRHAPDDPTEDGVLYGSEVLGCDLRGTDLVVLTACQTAQGDVHAGQSAAGMRQAFQLAGAREVIATLWSVDQASSKQLIQDFMAHLARGFPPMEALRESQLAWLKHSGRRHPFYWAAFTITGRGH